MEHTMIQKGQKATIGPTATQPNRLYTPGPVRVKPRDLYLGM